MAPDINLIKKSLIRKLGKTSSETDPEIISIFKKYQIELPDDINANFLTHKELIKLYDEISNYEYYKKKSDDSSDSSSWIDPAGGTHYNNEEDPAKMYESKIMNKKKLNETSHELDLTRNFMNYEDSDVVTSIKKAFEKSDYSDFTLINIQSNGDKFFNIEVSYELDEDETINLEFARATLVQKIHKLRSKLFADIANEIPVINSNIASIQLGKASDIAKFVITLLISDTNNRDWVTGARKKAIKEAVEVKKEVSLVEGNLYHYEKDNKTLVLEYVEKIQGGRKFKILDKGLEPESFSIRESEIETVIKTKQSLDESLNNLLEFSIAPKNRPRDTHSGDNLTIDQLRLLVQKFREWCKLATNYEPGNYRKAEELAVKYLVPYNLVRTEPGEENDGYAFYDVTECTIKNPNFKKAIERLAQEYIY